ncbi:MAG: hypothetical protein GEV03_10705 [Streptosporangiales bacterium]|nr:hypothetical protein [Streptosporangiales bacterium]
MSLDFPVPVQDAIVVSHKIDASIGSTVESLITMLWGDVDRVDQVGVLWGQGGDDATDSINALRQELRGVADEQFWQGPAKDSYQAWIEQLIDQTLAPVRSGLEDVGKTLHDSARTIEDMRKSLVRLCASFVGTVAGLLGGPFGWPVALVLGAWFVTELMDFQVDYVNALDEHAGRMRDIGDTTVGSVDDSATKMLGPTIPVALPVIKKEITPPLDRSILGDWDNWEHGDPKIKKP